MLVIRLSATSMRRAPRPPAFGIVTVSTPSFRSAVTLSTSIALGQHEGARKAAVAALDAVILLARNIRPGVATALAANDDAALLGVDVDLVARQAGQFRGQHELVAVSYRSTGGVQPGASVPTS